MILTNWPEPGSGASTTTCLLEGYWLDGQSGFPNELVKLSLGHGVTPVVDESRGLQKVRRRLLESEASSIVCAYSLSVLLVGQNGEHGRRFDNHEDG